MLVAIAFGLLVGLPSLRLRADYFAIATIAFAEIVRLSAQNARGLTGGNQGLLRFRRADWDDVSDTIQGWLESARLERSRRRCSRCCSRSGRPLLLATALLYFAQRSPWGRVLRAIREDEDAARALGKNTLAYKLQSLAIAGDARRARRLLPRARLTFLYPTEFEPLFTFIGYAILVLGGLATTGAWRSAPSSCGRCSRARASSTCR